MHLYSQPIFRIRIQLNLDPGPAKNINPDPSQLKDIPTGNVVQSKIIFC